MVKFLCGLKEKTIEDAVVIGIEEGGLYKLKGHLDAALTHNTISPCEFGIEGLLTLNKNPYHM
jgi:hypothetical protein